LAEAKTEEEKLAAEKLLAEKETAAKVAAEAKAKAEIEKANAEKAAAQKAAAQKSAAQKVASEKANSQTKENMNPPKEVTISVYTGVLSDEEFNYIQGGPLKEKYPHIRLKVLRPAEVGNIQTLVTANQIPDIIAIWSGGLVDLKELGLPTDLRPLLKEVNFNLDRLNPTSLDEYGIIDSNGLNALPYSIQYSLLYYNKAIFDKFGISYPKPGMTWDELYHLAKSLTRKDGNVQYHGMLLNTWALFDAFPLTFVNEKTKKANIVYEDWKRVFETAKSIYDIPGNRPPANQTALNLFTKNQTVALLPERGSSFINIKPAVETGLKLGVTTFPSYKDKPYTNMPFNSLTHIITKQSPNKLAAMQFLDVLLSDEVQEYMTKNGRLTTLRKDKTREQLWLNEPLISRNDAKNILMGDASQARNYTKYDAIGMAELNKAWRAYINGTSGKDINTLLKEIEEEINKKVRELN